MSIAGDFLNLFAGLERAHGRYILPSTPIDSVKQKGDGKTLAGGATEELWQTHLDGGPGLGIIPIRDDSTVVWGGIDVDIYDLDLVALEQRLVKAELPLVMCRTKSGGAHLYLFTSVPVKAKLMREKLLKFASHLGYPDIEIFPKQIKQDSEAGFGNWLNMPYHNDVGDLTTRYCIKNGRAITSTQFIEYANSKKIDEAELKSLTPLVSTEDLADGPPCLQHMVVNGFPAGSMNNALFSMGVYARKKFPEDWEAKIHEYNQQYMGPGSFQEVQNIIKALTKKSYIYRCSDIPLCSHCNKTECYKRQFGIKKIGRPSGGGGDKEEVPCILDEVDRPVKVHVPAAGSGDDPQWTFCIGGKTLEVSLDMLLDQMKFNREYTRQFRRLLMPVKTFAWVEGVNEIMAEAIEVDLPEDAGPEGQLMLHLEAFTNGKAQARDKSELLIHRPWHDAGMVWFRSKDFFTYLDQQHFRQFKEKEMWPIFRKNGAKHDKFMIKGVCVGVWGVKAFAQQNEDFDEVVIPVEGSIQDEGAPF